VLQGCKTTKLNNQRDKIEMPYAKGFDETYVIKASNIIDTFWGEFFKNEK